MKTSICFLAFDKFMNVNILGTLTYYAKQHLSFLFNIFVLTKFLYVFPGVYRHINEVFRPYSLKKDAWERSGDNEIFLLNAK